MKPQDPPPAHELGHSFATAIDQALTEHVRYKKTYLHAFDIGIRAPDLFRYAFGQLDEVRRREYTELVARSPWALKTVVALVKAKRNNTPPRFLVYDSSGQDDLEALKLLDQF